MNSFINIHDPDIFFSPAYGKLYEQIDGGTCETFSFTCKHGIVRNIFIKRPVPWLVDGKQYYDARTPYGYGGPVMIDATDRIQLESAYWRAYTEYCSDNDIICEFVRFHPLVDNVLDFQNTYNVKFDRNTIAVELSEMDYMRTQFSSECRNMIRKAQKRGIDIKFDTACVGIQRFIELYSFTMDKNHASRYYYFPDTYFDSMQKTLNEHVLLAEAYLENNMIAAALFLYGGNRMYYHLSATHPDYYSYAANNLVLAKVCEYAKSHSIEQLYLGGGYASGEDSLFKFKRSFGRTDGNLKRFYTGKAVFNTDTYQRLVEIAKAEAALDIGYFPLYRGKRM